MSEGHDVLENKVQDMSEALVFTKELKDLIFSHKAL